MAGQEASPPREVGAPVGDHVADVLAALEAQDRGVVEPLEEGLHILGPHERVGRRVDHQVRSTRAGANLGPTRSLPVVGD